LQGKRGIEKPPFDLPDFIKKTGIMEMRAALQEKEDQRTLKAKMRERARPKLGKIDIDYQKLHDAFFKYALLCVPYSTVYNFRDICLYCSEVLVSLRDIVYTVHRVCNKQYLNQLCALVFLYVAATRFGC
jgi:hypothetical protein